MRGSELVTTEVLQKISEALETVITDFFPQKSGWFIPPSSVSQDVLKLELPDGIGTLTILIEYKEEDNQH